LDTMCFPAFPRVSGKAVSERFRTPLVEGSGKRSTGNAQRSTKMIMGTGRCRHAEEAPMAPERQPTPRMEPTPGVKRPTPVTEPLCPGCTALARRPVTMAACAAGLRRVGGVE